MKLLSRCTALVLLCGLMGTASAQPAPATTPSDRAQRAVEWCQQNAERCAELKARREAKCAENPQKCEERRQRFEQRRAECAADPEKCKAERRKKMEEHRSKLQQACQEQPDGRACKRLQHLDRKLDAKQS